MDCRFAERQVRGAGAGGGRVRSLPSGAAGVRERQQPALHHGAAGAQSAGAGRPGEQQKGRGSGQGQGPEPRKGGGGGRPSVRTAAGRCAGPDGLRPAVPEAGRASTLQRTG